MDIQRPSHFGDTQKGKDKKLMKIPSDCLWLLAVVNLHCHLDWRLLTSLDVSLVEPSPEWVH